MASANSFGYPCRRVTPLILLISAFAFPSILTWAAGSSIQLRDSHSVRLMNPQRPSASGPWFEGWYARLTDRAGQRSVAVIVASTLSGVDSRRVMKDVPGYIAVLVSEGDGNPTLSFEAFPAATSILLKGEPMSRESDASDDVSFEWQAPGFGYMTDSEIRLRLPKESGIGEVVFNASIGARVPWSRDANDFGPQGLASLFKFLPLHWYVDSRSSESQYELKLSDALSDSTERGTGFLHREKNWGIAFPSAWMWVQAYDPFDSTYLALAGGRVEHAAMEMTTFMLGYRSREVEATFRPSEPETQFHRWIDPCTNTFHLRAQNLVHEIRIRATAPSESFGTVSIPTKEGYKRNGGRESFSSTVEVEVYDNRWWSGFLANRLIEKKVFHNAALEFGADYQECGPKGRREH